MGQEQVEGADRLLDHDGDPFYIVEGDVDLLGPVADVRRAAGGQQRHHHDRRHQDDHGDEGQGLALAVGQVRGRRAGGGPAPRPTATRRRRRHEQQQPGQPPPAGVLPGDAHIGHVGGQDLVRVAVMVARIGYMCHLGDFAESPSAATGQRADGRAGR